MSRPGDEITSDDALTLALQVVLSSDLSVEQCSALIAKLEKNGKAQVADIVAKTTAAHEGLVDLSNWAPMKLWQQIKNSLTAWEIAWYSNLPQGKVGKYRRSLSATQRQLAQRNLPAVDLTALPTIQSDFVFMLAYAGIEPLSADVLDAVWSKCSAYAATGTRIRSLMEAFMRGDKHLGRWVDQPSKKRSQSEIEGEMNGIQIASNKKRHHTDPTVPPPLSDLSPMYPIQNNLPSYSISSKDYNSIEGGTNNYDTMVGNNVTDNGINPGVLNDAGLNNGGAIGNLFPYGVIESIPNSELGPFSSYFFQPNTTDTSLPPLTSTARPWGP